MSRGYVCVFLLILCVMATGGYAEEQQVPFVSAPSLSITSASGTDDPVPVATNELNPAAGNPVIQATNKIVQGDIVFIGEGSLDVTSALNTAGYIAWWQSGNLNPAAPDAVIPVPDPYNFRLDPADFVQKTGDWYQWVDNQKGELAFRVADPSLYLEIWDASTNTDVTGKTIPMGNLGTFCIDSNLYSIMNRTGYLPGDSSITITVTSPSGDSLTYLVGLNGAEHPLTHLQVDLPRWYWIGQGTDHSVPSHEDGWNTSVSYPNGTRIYQPGIYTVRAECNVNRMKNNYKAPDGSDYVNKTVSMTHTVNLVDDAVDIRASPELVVPGESFATIITGLPHNEYYLWMKGTGTMTGQPGDQPPVIALMQDNVVHDAPSGPYLIGDYVFSDGGGKTIRNDVPRDPTWNGTQFYGMVKLDATGTRTVYWNTSAATKPGSYTPAVEKRTLSGYVSDTCMLSVDTGNVSSLNLLSGWNFISTPKTLSPGHNTMAIFSGINSSGHSIFTYDSTTSSWVTMKSEDPFSPLTGFWLYSVQPTTIPLISDNATVVPRTLVKGWNSIGITAPDRIAATVLQPFGEAWSYLIGYDAQVQQYRNPLVLGDPAVNTTTLYTKEGYWIYVKENLTFSG